MTPPIVSNMKANKPNTMILIVSTDTKTSAFMLADMVIPKSKVIRFAKEFCAVSDRDLKTPHSLIRFPNIKNPTKDTDAGALSRQSVYQLLTNEQQYFLKVHIQSLLYQEILTCSPLGNKFHHSLYIQGFRALLTR
jgi:hypothetical protein